MCGHDVGGDVTGRREKGLGVPLIPDRALARSQPARFRRGHSGAFETRSPAVVATAAASIAALVVAAALGAVPVPAAAAVSLLVPAAVVDVERRRLPDAWVAAAAMTLLTTLAIASAIGRSSETSPMVDGLVGGAAAMALPVLALHLLSPASMGFGDVKVATVLGGAVGTVDWRLGAVALCVAALSGATVGVLTRRRTIPFGPFLVLGAWCALLAHQPIVDLLLTSGAAS